MQLEVKPYKAEIWKGKNESSVLTDNTQSLNQAETMSSKGKCIYNHK